MISGALLEKADKVARFVAILGNGKRLAILCLLVNGEMSVGAIAEKVQLSQSALSQHLAKLRSEALVATRRDRQTIFYSCRSEQVKEVLDTLDVLFGEPGDGKSGRASQRGNKPSLPS